MLVLRAAINDPTKKIALTNRSIGLRPQTSLILPQIGVAAAAARRYEDPIQV